jgi:hypothetical protein
LGLENDVEISCPYCGSPFSIRIDQTGGRRQEFVTDCEVCCSPIDVEIDIDEDGEPNVIAKRSGEG